MYSLSSPRVVFNTLGVVFRTRQGKRAIQAIIEFCLWTIFRGDYKFSTVGSIAASKLSDRVASPNSIRSFPLVRLLWQPNFLNEKWWRREKKSSLLLVSINLMLASSAELLTDEQTESSRFLLPLTRVFVMLTGCEGRLWAVKWVGVVNKV